MEKNKIVFGWLLWKKKKISELDLFTYSFIILYARLMKFYL